MHFSFQQAKLQSCCIEMKHCSNSNSKKNDDDEYISEETVLPVCIACLQRKLVSISIPSLIWRWHTKVIHISSKLFTLSVLEWNSSRTRTRWCVCMCLHSPFERNWSEKKKALRTSLTYVSVTQIARTVSSILMHICKLGYTHTKNNNNKKRALYEFLVVDVVVHLKLLLLHLLVVTVA